MKTLIYVINIQFKFCFHRCVQIILYLYYWSAVRLMLKIHVSIIKLFSADSEQTKKIFIAYLFHT